MKIFVKDNFNPDSCSGWLLLPLFIAACAFLISEVDDYALVSIFTLSFFVILIASLIGRTYILSLILMLITFILAALIDGSFTIITALVAVVSFTISFIAISYYKRALNFFNRKAFWLDTTKISPEDMALRNRLGVYIYCGIFIATIALISYFPFTGHAPIADAMVFFPLISLLGTICALLVGYERYFGIIILSVFVSIGLFPVIGEGAIIALFPTAITIAIGVWTVIGYYGNTNKISIEKVAAYVFKCYSCKKNEGEKS